MGPKRRQGRRRWQDSAECAREVKGEDHARKTRRRRPEDSAQRRGPVAMQRPRQQTPAAPSAAA
eukprot:4781444-Pyramimonas_sp.AAC.1